MEEIIDGLPRSYWVSKGYKILEFEAKVTHPNGEVEYHRQSKPVRPNTCGVN